MPDVVHSGLTGSDLHEPKGADSATANQIYVANGSSSGTFKKITKDSIDPESATSGKVLTSDGTNTSFENVDPTTLDSTSVGTKENVAIGSDGSNGMRFLGNSSAMYEDITISGLVLQTGGGSNPPGWATFRNGISLYTFAGTGTADEAWFSIHIPHNIAQGEDITFHVHWSHIIASPTGNVVWQLEYTMARGYEKDTYPATTTLSSTQVAGAQYAHHITNDDDMTISFSSDNIEPDAVILCRIFRDPAHASDTFANDAYLINVDVHYKVEQIATTERNRPFTSGGFAT